MQNSHRFAKSDNLPLSGLLGYLSRHSGQEEQATGKQANRNWPCKLQSPKQITEEPGPLSQIYILPARHVKSSSPGTRQISWQNAHTGASRTLSKFAHGPCSLRHLQHKTYKKVYLTGGFTNTSSNKWYLVIYMLSYLPCCFSHELSSFFGLPFSQSQGRKEISLILA